MIVPEFISKRDGVKMLGNSSIRDLYSQGMSLIAKAGAASPMEGGEACS